jgi:hypothetical protein
MVKSLQIAQKREAVLDAIRATTFTGSGVAKTTLALAFRPA